MKFALNIHSHLCLSLFQVMRTILDLLPQNPKVHQVMIDFEEAMWNYLYEVLPDVMVKGCVFHWTQALWRKVSKRSYSSSFSLMDKVKAGRSVQSFLIFAYNLIFFFFFLH